MKMRPTPELRWKAEHWEHPAELQQAWIDDAGKKEWRTVPTVLEEGEDAPKSSAQ